MQKNIKNKPNILVYSHNEFDLFCYKHNINDKNVEDAWKNYSFISIIGTKECQDKYLKENDYHWFKKNHKNVLNLNFDDISDYYLTYNNILFKGINERQAKQAYFFIKNNIGNNFIIHCRAGKSRSQAFCRYILDIYSDIYCIDNTRKDNPCNTPNLFVLGELKRQYYKNNKIFTNL